MNIKLRYHNLSLKRSISQERLKRDSFKGAGPCAPTIIEGYSALRCNKVQ